MALCCQSNSASAFDVNGAIGLRGRLGQNADEVEDGIGSYDRTADALSSRTSAWTIPELLASPRREADGLAYGQAHGLATSDKQRHETAADKAGSADIVMQPAILLRRYSYRDSLSDALSHQYCSRD